MVDAHNAQRLQEILDYSRTAMTLENLEAAYVAARTQGLLVFQDQQSIENHVLSQPHVKTADIRRYYESQEPPKRKQNMADFLPHGNISEQVSLDVDLVSPEVKAKSDPTLFYGEVLRKLSEQLGRQPSETSYAVVDYFMEQNPEYRLLPPERQEKTIEQVIDLMLEHGDPWTIENARKRLFELEADQDAIWTAMEEQGQKLPEPVFVEKSPLDEEYFFQTASTDAIRNYFERKFPQGAR
jgi:hypothetical protein